MTSGQFEPRRFGTFLLVAELEEDALGRVYRALRRSGERSFVRLRILESPEISEDAVLDAIEANGEIHGFLKNPAIARGVQMDAVDGTPFIAWNEASGRTLDSVLARLRDSGQTMPTEHGLLVAEKIATALDHAYNTTVDGERTLHGLVWPGFVSVSDDGEVRLTGFGLASGVFPTFSRPRFSSEIGPYLPREERNGLTVGRNSDVFSVGAVLFELLTGRPPSTADPLADLRAAGERIPPEVTEVLRMCLGDPQSRYQSAGELRRELGKLLFSGPYAPSTFNLAFFLNGLFSAEIEAENQARAREALLEAGPVREPDPAAPGALPAAGAAASGVAREGAGRTPVVVGGALLVGAALAGSAYLLLRRPSETARMVPVPQPRPTLAAAAATTPPLPAATAAPTNEMSEARFKEEVSRRVAAELKRLEQEVQQRNAAERKAAEGPRRPVAVTASARASLSPPAATPSASRAREEVRASRNAPPTPPPAVSPTAVAEARESAVTASTKPVAAAPSPAPVFEEPAKIKRIVKPLYPAVALQARIGGTVLLRVLVSETGTPIQVDVIRGVTGGLSEAAAAAVKRWTFEPARRNGVPVQSWTTVPIPFEP